MTALEIKIMKQGGFLHQPDLIALIAQERLRPVLVRHQGCRFVAPADCATHIIEALEAANDYCRDVSLPTTDRIWDGVRDLHELPAAQTSV
jgi:hypothetical protein